MGTFGSCPWEGEIDRRAPADHPFRPHATTVPIDDPVDRRQPDPGPRKVAFPVQALKRPKELVNVGHVESRTVVPNEVHGSIAGAIAAELHAGPCHLRGELPG